VQVRLFPRAQHCEIQFLRKLYDDLLPLVAALAARGVLLWL
jgi:hypothetical protein